MVFSAISAVDSRCLPLLRVMTSNSGHTIEGHQPKCRELSAKTVGDDSFKHQQWRRTLTQMLRVMRIIAVLLLAAVLQVSARTEAQTVTYSGKVVSLQEVFGAVKKQTGYFFFYRSEDLAGTAPVTVELNKVPLQKALATILAGQPLDFEIQGNTIVISRKELVNASGLLPADLGPGKLIKTHGVVLNDANQPLYGATVTVLKTNKSTFTNARGEFFLQGIPSSSILVVSFIGYSTRQVAINEQEYIKVYLSVAVNELDVAIIQGYGSTTRRLATGNIAKVSAEEIQRQPVMNPLLALQGKVAGLNVSQTSGFASAPIRVELRGRSAIGLGPGQSFPADPLYIIDGVPLTILEIGGSSNYTSGSTGFIQSPASFNGPAGGQSPLFSLNPSDIESIEVLKDADATAIYGSRAANGVILITTKKGKAGKSKFDLRINQGVTRQTRFYEMLNTEQYLSVRKEAIKNDGRTPSLQNGDYDLLLWGSTRYTDWQKELYGRTGKTLDVQASLSGGDARTTFRVGAGYNRTTNILTVSGADQRGSLSLSLSHHSLDQRLSLNFSNTYSVTQSDMISLPGSGIVLPPNAPSFFNEQGKLNYDGWGGEVNDRNARNALAVFSALEQPYTSRSNFLSSNMVLGYQILKGLQVSASLGYNKSQANQQIFYPIASFDPLNNPRGSNSFGINNNNSWIIEPQINYDIVIGRGRLSMLVGGSAQETNGNGTFINGSGYTSDDLLSTLSNAASQYSTDVYGKYRYAAAFGRLTYNWKNKYIININARRDGSSRFGNRKQFGNFGSVGAAWIITGEKWFEDHFRFLSFAKARASYGTTGSDVIGDYQYLTRWSSNITRPYNGNPTLSPIQHANPDFQWQVNKKLEVGIELAFLKDKISVAAAWYRNRCGNQLVGYPLAAFTGFTTVTANSAALVQNRGWEIIIGARLIESKNWKWAINFNISQNNNKLISYPNFELSPFVNQLFIGQPLNVIRLLHYTSVNPQTGEYEFTDRNHDGEISIQPGEKDDTWYYNMDPKFLGGFGTTLGFKNFQLNLFFNIKKQNAFNAIQYGVDAGRLGNQPVSVLDRWQKPGDLAPVAKFTTLSPPYLSNFRASDAGFTDASFIRLSNLAFSYSIPEHYLKSLHMQGCSLFFNTNNLFVITKYKGVDPEVTNFGGLPPVKILVAGLSLIF